MVLRNVVASSIFIISLIIFILALLTFSYLNGLIGDKQSALYTKGKRILELFFDVGGVIEEEEGIEGIEGIEEDHEIEEIEEEDVDEEGREILFYANAPSEVRHILGLLDFYKTLDKEHPVTNHIQLVGDYHKQDEEIISSMQKKYLDRILRFFLDATSSESVIFFDRHNFQGRIFMIPVGKENIREGLEFHEEKEISSFPLEVRNMWETKSMTNDDRFKKKNTYISYALSTRDEIPGLSDFIRLFIFYFNRPFSCAIPKNTIVKITPFKRDNMDDAPMIIREGEHKRLIYTLPMVRKFEIFREMKE